MSQKTPSESDSAQDADMITMGNVRNDHWFLEWTII